MSDSTMTEINTVRYVIYGFSVFTVILSLFGFYKIFTFHRRNNTWLYQYLRGGRIAPVHPGGAVAMMQYPFQAPGMQPFPQPGMYAPQGGFMMPMAAGGGGVHGGEPQPGQPGSPQGYIPPGGYYPPPDNPYPVGQVDPNQFVAATQNAQFMAATQNPQFMAAMQNPQFTAAMQNPQFMAAMQNPQLMTAMQNPQFGAAFQNPQFAWAQPAHSAAFPPGGINGGLSK
ncbi:hypothetical protein ATCC90586_010040 [Pythium insidiosum]|nr:hypothetical protein ATCC90586_010040 [Pythium insidiosum]